MTEEFLSQLLEEAKISQSDFKKLGLSYEELCRIEADYISKKPMLTYIADNVNNKLSRIVNVHSTRVRVKEPNRLILKIIRKRRDDPETYIDGNNYLEIIRDLVGARALHLLKENWVTIHHHILETWKLYNNESPEARVREGDKEEYNDLYRKYGCVINSSPLGYRSVHYTIVERGEKDRLVPCEIQVRTIYEEGYSELDHIVRYPNNMHNQYLNEQLSILNRITGTADELAQSIQLYCNNDIMKQSIKNESSKESCIKNVEVPSIRVNTLEYSTPISSNSTADYFRTIYPTGYNLSDDGRFQYDPVTGKTVEGSAWIIMGSAE